MFLYKSGDLVQIKHHAYKVCEVHEGGMGVVYLLKSVKPTNSLIYPEHIAAKLFKPEVSLGSLMNELNIWLSLRHPNILPLNVIGVIDYQTAALSNWRINGSLYSLLENGGPISYQKVKGILSDTVASLKYAWNEKRVLHLDIKPQNLLLSDLPWKNIQLADWGIAKLASEIHIAQARQHMHLIPEITSSFSGTIPYMAPERFLANHEPTISADIFSLGMLALQCLTGLLPFKVSRVSWINQILNGEYFECAITMAKPFSNRWCIFVQHCLAIDEGQRFENYDEVQYAIDRLEER